MTVATTAAKAGPYTGNNVASSFAFSFKVFADIDILVVETLISTEAESDLVLNTDYTVTRNADQDNNPGGSITYKVGGVTTALPSTKMLTIVGNFGYEQPTDIPNGGAWFATVVENALDRVTMLAKQLKEATDRAVKVPVSSSTDPDALIASLEASEAAAVAAAAAAASSAAAAAAAIPSGSLGYTPVDEAGHTMTGELALPSINLGGSGSYTSFGNVVTKTHGTASGNVPLVGTKSATKILPGLNYDIPQIQPVSASVGSNALTLTLNPTTLDFRSATLTDGTVNTRQVGAAISLVISSGSTLGTVNATAARIAILALDNAGTVELAAVNLAGGNNLDETTLISTTAEGGIGAADSASTIYSTTARTNVPFRVVGFVDITEATAGTWATAPTLVQGAGGLSLTGIDGQTVHVMTPGVDRAFNATYYNTTGKKLGLAVVGGYGSGTTMTLVINGVTTCRGYASASAEALITYEIPVGASYSITAALMTLNTWTERY